VHIETCRLHAVCAIESTPIPDRVAVAIPVAVLLHRSEGMSAVPDLLESLSLIVGFLRRVVEMELFELLDIRSPAAPREVPGTGERDQFAWPLDEAQFRVKGGGRHRSVGNHSYVEPGFIEAIDGGWVGESEAEPEHHPARLRRIEPEELPNSRTLRIGGREMESPGAVDRLAHPLSERHVLIQPHPIAHAAPKAPKFPALSILRASAVSGARAQEVRPAVTSSRAPSAPGRAEAVGRSVVDSLNSQAERIRVGGRVKWWMMSTKFGL
jgi:hypothetical protein